MDSFATTPEPPYYAVIFSSQRTEGDRGYGRDAKAIGAPHRLNSQVAMWPSAWRNWPPSSRVSYWTSLEAIAAWKREAEHQAAQEAGKRHWYADYQLRICCVERAYGRKQD
jgi:hypothetical protein